jgi:hypothetical protein
MSDRQMGLLLFAMVLASMLVAPAILAFEHS